MRTPEAGSQLRVDLGILQAKSDFGADIFISQHAVLLAIVSWFQ